MINGVLIVNKPTGMTSHDVVNIVRRLFNIRRVGHTGTLDPMATGVLPMLLGPATRLAQYMTHNEKRYQGTVKLGVQTSTYDADGEIEIVKPVQVSISAIHEALSKYRGEINQIPPMYSAIKIKGQKLYTLARQGITIEREPRTVTIHNIYVLDWQPPDLTLDVRCSAGTYIRSLAHDIGETLGCGAHLRTLKRTVSHGFTLADSHNLDMLKAYAQDGNLMQVLLPPRAALVNMQTAKLTPEQVRAVRYGQPIPLTTMASTHVLQAVNEEGDLVAVMITEDTEQWRPKVVMPAKEATSL